MTCCDEAMVVFRDSSSTLLDTSSLWSSWSWCSCSLSWTRRVRIKSLNKSQFLKAASQTSELSRLHECIHTQVLTADHVAAPHWVVSVSLTCCTGVSVMHNYSIYLSLTCLSATSWAAFTFSCISLLTSSTSSWAARATVICRVTSAFYIHTHRRAWDTGADMQRHTPK